MDGTFDTLFKDNPALVVLAPIIGLVVNWLKTTNKLAGWALLGAAFIATTLILGSFGLYQNWTPDDWRKAPFTLLLLVGGSVLVGTTVEHAKSETGNG